MTFSACLCVFLRMLSRVQWQCTHGTLYASLTVHCKQLHLQPLSCNRYRCVPWGSFLKLTLHGQYCHALPCHTLPYPSIPCHTLPYPTIPCHTLPYPSIPCHTLPYPAIPCHTLPYPEPVVLLRPHCACVAVVCSSGGSGVRCAVCIHLAKLTRAYQQNEHHTCFAISICLF